VRLRALRDRMVGFPTDGPVEVLARRHPILQRPVGGVMHRDLKHACYLSLAIPRAEARARAMDFSWRQAGEVFASYLVPARRTMTASASKARAWT
jgi:hypothetical protein